MKCIIIIVDVVEQTKSLSRILVEAPPDSEDNTQFNVILGPACDHSWARDRRFPF